MQTLQVACRIADPRPSAALCHFAGRHAICIACRVLSAALILAGMTDIPTPTRVALIGYGYAARTFHAPLIRAVSRLSLVLIASSRPELVRAELPGIAVEGDPMRAVVDPGVDLVVIATPNDTHFPLAQAALRAGKHVVVDKPMTPSLSEACELRATALAHGRCLSVFHNRRWDSDVLSVRQALREGLIGEARHFESRIERFRPQVRDRWRERPGPATGLWWDLGPHLVDQALALFGWPDTVQANLAQRRHDGRLGPRRAGVRSDQGRPACGDARRDSRAALRHAWHTRVAGQGAARSPGAAVD